MESKKDEIAAKSGWLGRKLITGRYGFVVDVLTFVPGVMLAFVALHYQPRILFSNRMMFFLTLPSISGLFAALVGLRLRWLVAAIAVAGYWGMLAALLILEFQGFTLFFLLFLPFLLLLVVALATTILMGLRTGFVWPLLAGMAGLFIGTGVTLELLNRHEQTNHPARAQDPVPLGQDFLKINKCAHEFRLSHAKDGYPESLQQLGPLGTACIPQALVNSRHKGFTLLYQPGEKDAAGRITTYVLKAEQAPPHGPNFSVMSTDESGLIGYTFRGPLAGNMSYAYSSPGSSVQYLIDCLRRRSADNRTALNAADKSVQTCWQRMMHADSSKTSQGKLSSPCLSITYKFSTNRSGLIDGFSATVRPTFYGDCGVRSYLIESNNSRIRMYATSDERPATRSDPLAKMCELQERGDCGRSAEID